MEQANPFNKNGTKYYALGLLTVVYTFNFIDRQLLAILQESIKADLLLSDTQLGLLTGFAFAVIYVTAGIPLARWADQSNRRNIVALAIGTWSFMTVISGAVQNYFQLLLARIGVGIGEAGGSPPAHSIISDIFPPQRRASALSIYSMGVNIGVLFGFLFGGWLNELFSWRVAFVVVGVPGILIALLVRFSLREPTRGLVEARSASEKAPPLKEVMGLLWNRSSFPFMAMGAATNAFAVYSMNNWTASFMIRSFDMTSGEVGTWLALILGLGGAIGLLLGGLLAERLAPRDTRWYMWVPAIAAFVSVPFAILTFTAATPALALWFFVIPGFLATVYLGNTLAMVHGLVGLRMRALASAILFFVLNIIGLGLGPTTVGLISDAIAPEYGPDSVRYALLAVVPIASALSGLCFLGAARTLRGDLDQAPE
ncbi:MAG: MFS transporter [Pseudomonadota bacterium]